jgi:hypothetical protein
MRFEFVPPENFFNLLYQDSEFCQAVGRVMLAASRLETNVRRYLRDKGIGGVGPKTTFGQLVAKMKENRLLTSNGETHFEDLALKRNYLAHSLYDLFTKEIEETILEREELTAGDTDIFVYRAENLAKDFNHFADIVLRNNGRDGVLAS